MVVAVMGILSGDHIQALFGATLAGLYEDASVSIYHRSTVRDPATGTFPLVHQGDYPAKAQRDECSYAQRQEDGYAHGDKRMLVLQHGFGATFPDQSGEARILYRGEAHRVQSIEEDPARAYWDCRVRLVQEA